MKGLLGKLLALVMIGAMFLGGNAPTALAQGAGPGQELCHPTGYCITVPDVPGWAGLYDSANNALSIVNTGSEEYYGLNLTYAPGIGAMTDISVFQPLLSNMLSAMQVNPTGDSEAVQAAGYDGVLQNFTADVLGEGAVIVLFLAPDVIAISLGANSGGPWDEATRQVLFDVTGSLTLPAEIDATQLISGEFASGTVALWTPVPGGAAPAEAAVLPTATPAAAAQQATPTTATGISGLGGGANTGASLLDGSFNTALAVTLYGEATSSGRPRQVALLQPAADGLNITPTRAEESFDTLVGWLDADNLLVMRYDETLPAAQNQRAALYNAASETDTVLAEGFDTSFHYMLTPDRARVVGWPDFAPQSLTSLGVVMVYDAAAMTPQNTFDLSSNPAAADVTTEPGLAAGLSSTRLYLQTMTPGDGLVAVDLDSGDLFGPADLLAAGDGDETAEQVAVSPQGGLVMVVGFVNPKSDAGLFLTPLQNTDGLPVVADTSGPRPLAQSAALPLDGAGAVTRVTWNNAGTQLAVFGSIADDFSANPVFLLNSAEPTAAVPTSGRAAFNSCAVFTPDDAWLLYLGEDRESLLALPTTDPAAAPQTLLSGVPGLDLCGASWQPEGSAAGISIGAATQPPATQPPATQPPATQPPATQAPAVNGTPLAVGDTVTGEITDDAPVVEFSLALRAGDPVTITMEARNDSLDTYLALLDPSGVEVISNDDAFPQVGDSPFNSQISSFAPAVDGTYTLQATRFGQEAGFSTGPFQLSVTAEVPLAASPTPAVSLPTQAPTATTAAATAGPGLPPGTLAVGSTVTGEITDTEYVVEYNIVLEANQSIGVTMQRTSGDLDTLLAIFDDKGNVVASNDDATDPIGDSPYNSHIVSYTADLGATYVIAATRYDFDEGTTTGGYTLSVTTAEPVILSEGGPITVGQTVTGELTDVVYAVDYQITLEQGQAVTITMQRTSGSLDSYLQVLDSEGVELAFNDDAEAEVGDSPLNAQIVSFSAPQAGTYNIRATRYQQTGDSSAGQFTLEVAPAG